MSEEFTDWDTVTYLRKKAPKASQLRSQQVCLSTKSEYSFIIYAIL